MMTVMSEKVLRLPAYGLKSLNLKDSKNYLKMAWKDKLNRYTILILVWYILAFLINLIIKLYATV